MNPEIPEEYKTMAVLLGESAAIDSLMINNPAQLATNTNTLKRGIAEYQEQQKRERMQPQQPEYPQVGMAPIERIPNYYPPQPLSQVSQYVHIPQKVDDGQLELNLEPSKADIIVNLLKEILLKLTKQNSMLEKQYAAKSEKERVPVLTPKPRRDP